eukprot:CAMPEP_0182432612 /NCGR_PEP_ID=MMETSP1167-20130531/57759_1 /TAXON_ID=2988 /ORGANISM="Mallomonas Sp, Strain CCMP3275" /LENGTH=62 /DNA_ID=CAMNT_0024620355 /DNA_START=32 /DNA_END=216 /DNA_ORIENTATION=+
MREKTVVSVDITTITSEMRDEREFASTSSQEKVSEDNATTSPVSRESTGVYSVEDRVSDPSS